MNLNRIAAASVSALVVLGGAGVASAQTVTDPTVPDPTTTVPEPTTTVPAPASDTFSLTIVGLGDLTVTVDPTTGDIANVVVAPIDGVTAGSPVPVHNGVQLDFTLADGTVSSIIIRTESHHTELELEIILPDGRKVELHGTTPVTIDPANPPTDDDDDDDEYEHHGQREGADESEHSGDHVRTAPDTPGTQRSGEVRRDDDHRPTVTTAPSGESSSSGSRSGSSRDSDGDRDSERERD